MQSNITRRLLIELRREFVPCRTLPLVEFGVANGTDTDDSPVGETGFAELIPFRFAELL